MKYSILCVDDEEIILESLKAELSSFLGGEAMVELAQSHHDAFEIVDDLLSNQIPVPVIISDFHMPHMKGDELLIHLHKLLPETKKILLTGQSSTEGIIKAINQADLYRYIHKPWSPKDLHITVKEAIKSYFLSDLANKQAIIVEQHNEIVAKNKQIQASIAYAKRIQQSILPTDHELRRVFGDAFALYLPKDGVSGDFYWLYERDHQAVLALGDCTGHGVPGAIMSMLGHNALTAIVEHGGTLQPSAILKETNNYIVHSLRQNTAQHRDGMDLAVCLFDWKNRTVTYAGAMIPLLMIQDGVPVEIKPDRTPLGGFNAGLDKVEFKEHSISLGEPWRGKETLLYMYSDGYQDQFGGKSKGKFMAKRLKETIVENHKMPMAYQKQTILNTHLAWRQDANEKQTDDIALLGVKIIS